MTPASRIRPLQVQRPELGKGRTPLVLALTLTLTLALTLWTGTASAQDPSPAATPQAATAAAAASAAEALPPSPGNAGSEPAQDEVAPATPPAPPAAPRVRLDPEQDAERLDLWQRVREGFVLPDVHGELVRNWEQYYATRSDYVQRMTERGARYLFYVTEEVTRRGLPMELVLLPFIESAFNPQAMSTAKASGMWQFMPATGKDFLLRQNLFRDDRRHVLASTTAALDYLEKLYKKFDDWQLALAAYNWGQGNVQRAVDANRKRGLGVGYTQLDMPAETRNYVPKLQAVKNIVLAPERFALQLPTLHNHPFFLSVDIDRDIDVAVAASLAGLSVEEFQHLNPQLNKPVILAAGTPQVLLPYDSANRFLRELARRRAPLASWTAWVVPRTLKPADAARQVGMSEEQMRELNRIPERMLVKAGSTLLVPRGANTTADVSERVADSAAINLAPEPRPVQRTAVQPGRPNRAGTKLAAAGTQGPRPALHATTRPKARAVSNALAKPGKAPVVLQARGKTVPAAKRARQATVVASNTKARVDKDATVRR